MAQMKGFRWRTMPSFVHVQGGLAVGGCSSAHLHLLQKQQQLQQLLLPLLLTVFLLMVLLLIWSLLDAAQSCMPMQILIFQHVSMLFAILLQKQVAMHPFCLSTSLIMMQSALYVCLLQGVYYAWPPKHRSHQLSGQCEAIASSCPS